MLFYCLKKNNFSYWQRSRGCQSGHFGSSRRCFGLSHFGHCLAGFTNFRLFRLIPFTMDLNGEKVLRMKIEISIKYFVKRPSIYLRSSVYAFCVGRRTPFLVNPLFRLRRWYLLSTLRSFLLALFRSSLRRFHLL